MKASLIENICCPPFSGFKYSERREKREIGGDNKNDRLHWCAHVIIMYTPTPEEAALLI